MAASRGPKKKRSVMAGGKQLQVGEKGVFRERMGKPRDKREREIRKMIQSVLLS